MTPGEPTGRGYGHDDRYPPPRPSYPEGREDWAAGPGRFHSAGYDPSGEWRVTPPPPEPPPAAHRPWDPAGDDHRYAWPAAGGAGRPTRGAWPEPDPFDRWPRRAGYPADGQAARHRLPRGAGDDGPPPGAGDAPRRSRSAEPEPEPARRRRRKLPLWQELPLLLVIAFCLAVLIRTFLLQAFYIPSGSMEDTLIAGDRVLVNKLVYDFREPARGEVVVFQGPPSWAPQAGVDPDAGMFARIGRTLGNLVGVGQPGDKDFIKRVIGLPGDVISCCDEGRVVVNGVPLEEPYVVRDSPLSEDGAGTGRDCRNRQFEEVVVPPGELFVMGDHRQRSQDSRCQGTIPIENVIGRAFLIVWPNDRWAGLSATDAFAEVPAPVAAGAPAADPGAAGQVGLVLPLLLPLAARRGCTAPTARSSRRRLSA